MIKNIFAVILILIGGFLAYGIIGHLLRIFNSDKIAASIVSVNKIENNYKKFDTPSYTNYPVLRFPYKNKILQITDKNQSATENEINNKVNIYYSEKYGITRGFTAFHWTFCIISFTFLFFGVVILSNRKSRI
ncbi:hypothetical protein [Epilithonimonas sp.]|uniref:hypothetical protein n=1 Tax=Epilithonimonas sp. TaxID=2894511 RepID=UPI002FDE9D83